MTADAPLQQRFGLTVTPANVLGVRAVVLQEAQDLQSMLTSESERSMLPPLGSDPVSKDMSPEFNEVTTKLLAQANAHVADLFKLGEELAASAQAYGLSEADISAGFAPGASRSAASQTPPSFLQAAGLGSFANRPRARSIDELFTGRTS